MFALSKATLRRIKRHDKAARWVVTLGGMAVIASVIAIVALIVGTVLPLFQPARVRVLAEQPLPASVARQDVVAVGVEMGVDEKKSAGRPSSGPGRHGDVSRSAHGHDFGTDRGAGLQRRRHDGDAQFGTMPAPVDSSRGADRTGGILAGLVRRRDLVGRGRRASGRPAAASKAQPICTVRTRATIPPENGPTPVRAIVRAPKDKEGVVTCAALLPDGRILLLRQINEENLAGDVTSKTQRTILRNHRACRPGRWLRQQRHALVELGAASLAAKLGHGSRGRHGGRPTPRRSGPSRPSRT